ncbi:MAG TPA: hypothetical protein VMX16_13990 [Terriglobia bacterium]|nr:hypothetical protein [Terriglobia bacterium]
MYIDTVPNRNSPPAVLLRESVRQGSRIRKRTLANLSHWTPARIQALRCALRGEFDHLSHPDPQLGACFGLLFALKQIADRTAITAALGKGRLAKLALFLVLARVAHQGSRLSAVRWAEDQAVAEVLGLGKFDEDDLYAALDDLSARQGKIEKALYRHYLDHRAQPPRLFLYDVTSSYLEGEQNELGAYGYNRDGKRGKFEIVIGLLADEQGEPLAVRVFEGNRSDPTTVVEQIKILQEQFGVKELVFVGDRGMVKSEGKQVLSAQQVHDSYRAIEKVERDFRTLKTGLLEVRPVWVRKESRTRGHVFCCLLALKLSREIERRLRATFGTTGAGPQAITLPDALTALTRLCLLHYQVDEKTTVTRLPRPDARQEAILAALGVHLPKMKM